MAGGGQLEIPQGQLRGRRGRAALEPRHTHTHTHRVGSVAGPGDPTNPSSTLWHMYWACLVGSSLFLRCRVWNSLMARSSMSQIYCAKDGVDGLDLDHIPFFRLRLWPCSPRSRHDPADPVGTVDPVAKTGAGKPEYGPNPSPQRHCPRLTSFFGIRAGHGRPLVSPGTHTAHVQKTLLRRAAGVEEHVLINARRIT